MFSLNIKFMSWKYRPFNKFLFGRVSLVALLDIPGHNGMWNLAAGEQVLHRFN
jgi:hypothetical protein